MTDQPSPLVSVLMATYNHGAYIRQAIQSVLDQQVPFAVELIISDDASTDDTLAIAKEMAARHPEIIRIVNSGQHLGLGGNFRFAYMQSRGKYIAMLDSDDYWLGRDKLVRQVAVMESDSHCTLSFHNAVIWTEGSRHSRMKLPKAIPEFRGGSYFLTRNPVTTMTAMFPRIIDPRILDALPGLDVQDMPMWIWLADHGSVKCIPDLFAVYRIHKKGTYIQANNLSRLQTKCEWLRRVRDLVLPDTRRALDRELAKTLLNLSLRKMLQMKQPAAASADWREACASAARGGVGVWSFAGMMVSAGLQGASFALAKFVALLRGRSQSRGD